MVSPNDMMAAAKEEMLEGREPESKEDWINIVRFLAVNIHRDLVHGALKLFRVMYHIPLTEREIRGIVSFQLSVEASRN
jgi:hypothetical protein